MAKQTLGHKPEGPWTIAAFFATVGQLVFALLAGLLPAIREVVGTLLLGAAIALAVAWWRFPGAPRSWPAWIRTCGPPVVAGLGVAVLLSTVLNKVDGEPRIASPVQPGLHSPATHPTAAPAQPTNLGCFSDSVFRDVPADRITRIPISNVGQPLGPPASDRRSLAGQYGILVIHGDKPSVVGAVRVTYDPASDQLHVDEVTDAECQQVSNISDTTMSGGGHVRLSLPTGSPFLRFGTDDTGHDVTVRVAMSW
jgi:hypothetical protein